LFASLERKRRNGFGGWKI